MERVREVRWDRREGGKTDKGYEKDEKDEKVVLTFPIMCNLFFSCLIIYRTVTPTSNTHRLDGFGDGVGQIHASSCCIEMSFHISVINDHAS